MGWFGGGCGECGGGVAFGEGGGWSGCLWVSILWDLCKIDWGFTMSANVFELCVLHAIERPE